MGKSKLHNNTVEENAVNHLSIWLRNSKRITPDIKANDKTPFVDGNIKLLDVNGASIIIGTLEVQVKGILKTISSPPTYSVKRAFLEHCKSQNLPIILIVVYNNQKAFWMHMSKLVCNTYLTKMKASQKTIMVSFDETYYIQDNYTEHCVEKFINIINSQTLKLDDYECKSKKVEQLESEIRELNRHSNISIGKNSQKYKEIHVFLDFYNNLLDNDFYALKDAIYPNYWKIGVAIHNYQDKSLSLSFYPISYELNDVQIKEFEHKYDIQQSHIEDINSYAFRRISRANSRINPIKLHPQQYAYECIKFNLIGYSNKLQIPLLIKNKSLAVEYLFDFVNNCYNQLNLLYGQSVYLLADIEGKLLEYENNAMSYYNHQKLLLSNGVDVVIGNTISSFHLSEAKQLITYLKEIGVSNISKNDYFSLASPESNDIIIIRKRFYINIPEVYDLLVKTYFPNLVNELQFFNDFNLLVIVFDSSPRNKRITGIELCEEHFYLKSLSASASKIIFYNNVDECPIKYNVYDFSTVIEIEGIHYKLQKTNGTQLYQYERTPLMTFVHDLLKDRFTSYFETKINQFCNY